MPAAFVAVRKFARAALLRGAGLFAALLFAAGFVGGVAGEGLGAGNVAHAQVPDAPQNIAATPGPGVVVLTWTQHSSNASRGVTAHVVYVSNNPYLTVSGDATAATLTGLPPNAVPDTYGTGEYAMFVRAQNAQGLGAQSGALLAKPGAATAPSAPSASGAPTPDGVSPANVTLSWSAPAANGSPITAYLLSYGGTVSETLPASQTATVIGVSLGVAYRFTLRAANAIGNSPAAVVAASISPPVTAPSAVQNFAVTAGDRLFVVTWDPPSDWGNSQLSAYIVSMGILNNFDVYTVANAAITLTTHSYHADGVLNPSDTYKIQVVPRSQAGLTGPMVELVRAPGQSPDAPNVTTSAPASGTQLSVSWSAANADSHNTAATAYAVRLGSVAATLGSSTTSTIIGNLQGNTAYTLSVWGISSVGAGAARVVTATTAMPPVTAPGPARNLRLAEAGTNYFVIAWDEPASWGGSTVSLYNAWWYAPGDSPSEAVTINAGGNPKDTRRTLNLASHEVHAGNYNFYVWVQSEANLWGAPNSTLQAALAVATAPSVSFATVTALASGTQISVSLSVGDGGSALTGLTLLYGGTAALTLSPTIRAAVIASLSANTAYTLSIVAVNAVGAATAVATATTPAPPVTDPDKPRNVRAVEVGDGFVVIAWDEPASWGGSTMSVYRPYYREAGDSWSRVGGADVTVYATSYTLTQSGLNNGNAHHFHVLAQSRANLWSQPYTDLLSPSFVATLIATPQAAATAPSVSFATVTALASGTQISVSLSVNNGGSSLTGLTLLYGGTAALTLSPTTRAAVIASLSANTAYTLSIVAVNSVGAATAVATATTPAAAATNPSAPRNFSVASGDVRLGLVLSWDEPASWGGSTLGVYSVGINIYSEGWENYETTDTRLTIANYSGSGLANWRPGPANLRILARSQAGLNSGYVNLTSPAFVVSPDMPNVAATALASGTEISVNWSRRNNDSNNTAATAYVLRLGTVNATLASATTLTVVGNLQGNTGYTLSVWGISPAGAGAVRVLNLTTAPLPSAPDAPTVNVATTPTGEAAATVTLSWSAPANGGSAITAYFLSYGTVSANLPASQTATAIGVSLGVAYVFTLQAANSIGASPAAVVNASIAASFTAPTPPRNFVVVTGNLSFVISWDEPASWGGSTLSIYRFAWRDTNDNTQVHEVTDNKVTLSTRLDPNSGNNVPLIAGNGYYIFIGARSQANLDSSFTRFPAAGFLTAVALSAPSVSFATVTALASGTEISISLLVDDGGALSGLTLLYGGTEELSLPLTTRATVITGLSANTAYTLSIVAVNAVGAATAVATATTPSAPPSAPRNFRVVSRDARYGFVVEWDEPASWGGSTLSLYRVGMDIGFQGESFYETANTRLTITMHQGAALISWAGGGFPRYRIRARSQAGVDSAWSAAFTDNTNATYSPDAPNVMATALASGTQISVSWSKFSNTSQNNAATAYVARLGNVNSTLAASITSTVFGGLQTNTAYTLSVQGVSPIGAGAVRVLTLTTAATAPSAPVLAAAATPAGATPSQVTLSWSVADNGGSAITAYILSYGTVSANLPASQTATVIGVSFDVAYSFTLQAANAIGASPATVVNASIAENITPPDTPPNAPRLSLAVLGNGFGVNVSLSWSVSESADNRVEYFVLSYNGGSHTLAASAASTVVAGLTRGQSYAFALHAVNAAGNSQTARATATIRLLAPLPPANLRATAGDQTLSFEWSAPAYWGGSEATGESTLGHYYVVHFYDSAASVLHTAAITATQITISQSEGLSVSLANGQQYGFSVAAVNQASVTSEFSALSNVRPRGVGQDAAPDAVVLQAAAGAFSRAFSTPINDRLLAIDGGGNAASAGFMGANFAGAGGAERGIAQLLKRHGNAIANGGNFDSAALRNGSFVMPLGNGGGNAGAGAMGLAKSDILSDLAGIVDRLTDWLGKAGGGAGNMLNNAAVWGGASYRGVENNKNADKWEGNSASYYLGIDSAVGEANENGGVLAGVVFAHNRFKSDYKLANNGGEGEYNVAANSAHPYLLWRSANGKNRAWGSFGFGVGNVERKGAAGDASDRNAKVGGGSAGFRGAVWQRKGVAIDAQADWSFANINIDGGAAARANNLRALLEARGSVAMAGGGFGSPFAQLGYVRQADDANNGAGWEAAAGWRWRGAGGWSGELRGGAASISNGNKEWSAAGVLRKAAANSKGFSMSLRPQYGDAGGSNIAGGGDFWSMPVAKESANPRLGINAKLGYGFTAANALWKPYLSANTAAGASAAYGAGAAWQNLLQSNLALRAAVQARRQEQATALQLRFTATY